MSSTPTPTRHPTRSTPSRPRPLVPLLLAGLLLVAGVVGSLVMTALGDAAVTSAIEGASHGPSSGFTVTTHPDPYFVYSEDGTPARAVTVRAPDGSTLPVTMSATSFGYGPHKEGLQVGTFQAPAGAGLVDYEVVVTMDDSAPDAPIAVTTFDVASFDRLRMVAVLTLLVVNVGVAAVIGVWALRRTA